MIDHSIIICRTADGESILKESKIPESTEANGKTVTTSTRVSNTTEAARKLYMVKDEGQLKFPHLLLERILRNKRKNEELELEYQRLRKERIKMNQTLVARRLAKATLSNETIEIS